MPIVDEATKGTKDADDEISDGEAIYSALSLVFSESPPEEVMAAALAVQQGTDWVELTPAVRGIFEDVAEEIFGDTEDDDEDEDDDEENGKQTA